MLDSSRRVFIQTCRRHAPGTKTNFAEMAVLRAATAVWAAQAQAPQKKVRPPTRPKSAKFTFVLRLSGGEAKGSLDGSPFCGLFFCFSFKAFLKSFNRSAATWQSLARAGKHKDRPHRLHGGINGFLPGFVDFFPGFNGFLLEFVDLSMDLRYKRAWYTVKCIRKHPPGEKILKHRQAL